MCGGWLQKKKKKHVLTCQGLEALVSHSVLGPGQRFQRYNTMGKYRTDLCRNASLVRRLHRRLKHAFDVQEPFERWEAVCGSKQF